MEIVLSSRVYLSLGSNLGDRHNYLQTAIALIKQSVGTVVSNSRIYETPPWGFTSESAFLNMCIAIDTTLNPHETLKAIKDIEIELGRNVKTSENYSSRKIDIDIILFDSVILSEEKLNIPHKHYTHRRFVLYPLNDIATAVIDPVTHLTVEQLLVNCKDTSAVHCYTKES